LIVQSQITNHKSQIQVSPRTTRLVRVPDLHTFRQAIVDLACGGPPLDARNRLVVIPTQAAAAHLLRAIEDRRLAPGDALALPDFITRDELIGRLADRLPGQRARLAEPEREVLAGVACRMAIGEGNEPPFRLRPGLVAEIVRFYDSLQRNLRDVDTFERLALGALEPGAAHDRGAERLVRQTRFLVSAFRHFECLVATTGRADEHVLRTRLIAETSTRPWRHVVVGVGDHAFDRFGLAAADWDLLSRVPGLERIDLVATDGMVAGAFHERIHQCLPGIEEVRIAPDRERPPPVLLVVPSAARTFSATAEASAKPRHSAPEASDGGTVREEAGREGPPRISYLARDREEEVAGFARWVRAEMRTNESGGVSRLGRIALVVRRPLPYVYLTREVLRSAGIPLQMFDALPLASEAVAAAVDLVMAFVAGNFARGPAIALLRSPHFRFGPPDEALTPGEVSALDRALSDAGYLGDLATLERLVTTWSDGQGSRAGVGRAADTLLDAARRLAPLQRRAPCADHLAGLQEFLVEYEAPPVGDEAIGSRHRRGRAAVFDALASLRQAYAGFDARDVEFDETAAVLRRWIDAQTFSPRAGESGIHLVDADSAKFGDFDAVQLAGLIDGEWPDAPRRNIFYSPGLLRELGWPSETDRLDGIRASFNDLLRLPSSRLVVSTFALEDDAVVAGSALIDALTGAGLEAREAVAPAARIFEYEALGLEPVVTSALSPGARAAAALRIASPRRRTGATAGHVMAAYSLSALERYQDCPFKFFAADVLKLEEPPEDEPMLSPRARGRFVHEVFQRFFEAWDARGHGTITVERVDEARALFQQVAEPLLARFSEAEALLERARLFGSAASVGVVDVVLGLEASREAPVRERWLEYRLEGDFLLGASRAEAPATAGAAGGSAIPIKGVADRIDLLDGNRLRVIDYKSGYAPQPKRALQAPIYALCAQERLTARDGRPWQIDEASYVAFAGKRPLVRIVRPGAEASQVLEGARTRVVDIVGGIARGEFPPKPYELRICGYCAYPSVCRKDYVGDE
jgi:RecB family exonuclease